MDFYLESFRLTPEPEIGETAVGGVVFEHDSRAVAREILAAVRMEGHVLIVAHDGLGALVHRPARHAEEGLVGVEAAAADKAEHLDDAPPLHMIRGDDGEAAGQEDFARLRGRTGKRSLFFGLVGFFFVAAKQKEPDDLRTDDFRICLEICNMLAKRRHLLFMPAAKASASLASSIPSQTAS